MIFYLIELSTGFVAQRPCSLKGRLEGLVRREFLADLIDQKVLQCS